MPKRELTLDEIAAANALAAALSASDHTQESLGVAVGVSQGMIWQWLNQRSPVPARRAKALADALGVPPESISVDYRTTVGGPALYAHYKQMRAEGRDWVSSATGSSSGASGANTKTPAKVAKLTAEITRRFTGEELDAALALMAAVTKAPGKTGVKVTIIDALRDAAGACEVTTDEEFAGIRTETLRRLSDLVGALEAVNNLSVEPALQSDVANFMRIVDYIVAEHQPLIDAIWATKARADLAASGRLKARKPPPEVVGAPPSDLLRRELESLRGRPVTPEDVERLTQLARKQKEEPPRESLRAT